MLEQTIRGGYNFVCGSFSEVTYPQITRIVLLILLTWTTASAVVQQTATTKPVNENVDAHTNLGIKAAEANNLKEAERHFAAAASLAPSEPSTRNN